MGTGPLVRLVETELMPGMVAEEPALLNQSDAGQLMRRLIGQKDREHFVVLHLDARHRPRAAEVVSVGTLAASLVHPREVFKAAILRNSAAILCGHNHPSGDATPSPEDRAVCARLLSAGKLLEIELLDFVVVTPDAVVSVMS